MYLCTLGTSLIHTYALNRSQNLDLSYYSLFHLYDCLDQSYFKLQFSYINLIPLSPHNNIHLFIPITSMATYHIQFIYT